MKTHKPIKKNAAVINIIISLIYKLIQRNCCAFNSEAKTIIAIKYGIFYIKKIETYHLKKCKITAPLLSNNIIPFRKPYSLAQQL